MATKYIATGRIDTAAKSYLKGDDASDLPDVEALLACGAVEAVEVEDPAPVVPPAAPDTPKSLEDMTKDELLVIAAELNIEGRSSMVKADLLAAIQAAQAAAQAQGSGDNGGAQ